MKIYLAADHAGYKMKDEILLYIELEKENIIQKFKENGIILSDIEIVDFGAYHYDPEDDYPKFISVCAGAISSDIYTGSKNSFAIVFGGSGEGEAMVADKYQGVRAGVLNSENLEIVKLLREHNNANILSIGSRFISDEFAKKAVFTFLLTHFNEKENDKKTKYERRVEEIEDIEKTNLKAKNKNQEKDIEILEAQRKRVEDN